MSRRHRITALMLALVVAAGVLVMATVVASGSRASETAGPSSTKVAHSSVASTRSLLWGASAFPRGAESEIEAVEKLERSLGQQLRVVRRFERWEDQQLDEFDRWIKASERLMVLSIKPRRRDGSVVAWSAIASASPGDRVHAELVEWARQLKAYADPMYVALHHEPEAEPNRPYGSADDFRQAFRRFVDVVRAEGATNVQFMVMLTGYAFEVAPADRRHVDRWYPGDDVVDAVGGDVYNWSDCRGNADPWRPLAEMLEPMRVWGTAHPGEELWLPEWGSREDPLQPERKAKWLADAHVALASPAYAQFRGVAYFHNDDQASPACDWWLDSSPGALDAFAKMGRDPLFGGTDG